MDIAIIGGGPAGLSAAINARVKNQTVGLFSSDYRESGLYRAELLNNVLGTPPMSGKDYLELCIAQARDHGVEIIGGRVLSVLNMGDKFMIALGSDFYEARGVILASGIVQEKAFPGERELLGRGVSYCATCDGMLYRNKAVSVVIESREGIEEANYLREIGCDVTAVSGGRALHGLAEEIPVIRGKKIAVIGETGVEALEVEGRQIPCQGVFILRNTMAMSSLMPDLELKDGHIRVDRDMRTNIPGVWAAGDCTGRPYQVSKATGEGLIAALDAASYLKKEGDRTWQF